MSTAALETYREEVAITINKILDEINVLPMLAKQEYVKRKIGKAKASNNTKALLCLETIYLYLMT